MGCQSTLSHTLGSFTALLCCLQREHLFLAGSHGDARFHDLSDSDQTGSLIINPGNGALEGRGGTHPTHTPYPPTHVDFEDMVLSFFVDQIGASVQAWGTIATIRGALSRNQKLPLPSTLATVAGSTRAPYQCTAWQQIPGRVGAYCSSGAVLEARVSSLS